MSGQRYQYKAISVEGQPVAGEIEAPDIDQALATLTARGLRSAHVVALTEAAVTPAAGVTGDVTPANLSSGALVQLAEHLEMLAKSGLPLPQGLRAAAGDASHRNLAETLLEIARQVELGRSLDDVLAGQDVPHHLSRLIETGLRSGKLAEVLTAALQIDQSRRDMWRTVRRAVTYPLLVLGAYLLVLIGLALFVLPGLADVLTETTKLPWLSRVVFWFAGDRMLVALGVAAAALPMCWLMLRAFSPVRRQRLVTRVPFLGPMYHWSSVATWTRLLGLFLQNGIPAPEALRLAARGIDDANVAGESSKMAQLTSVGRKFSDALTAMHHLPPSLVPIVRWGEEADTLPDALRAAGEMFENRVRIRATFLQGALPPLIFVLVASGALTMMNAVLMPMITMINKFMYW